MSFIIQENIPLAPFTTMKVGGMARFFARVCNVRELSQAVVFADKNKIPFFTLGGGSNTLVSSLGFQGLVIKIEIKGTQYEDSRVTVGAGEKWEEFVQEVVARNLWGVENLSLIPGTVGGAVVQNIGAYGVEARDTIFSVDVFDIETREIKTFLTNECAFGYRESVFKKKKNLIVVRATFRLTKEPTLRIEYEDVKKYFERSGNISPALSEVRNAVIAIRRAKLPVPGIGTAGSFFKNPVVSMVQYVVLKKKFPDIKAYLQADNTVKLSAGWLLDHVGCFRGTRRENAGVHEKQALILVNYGGAKAEEIISLAHEMKEEIRKKTNVMLEEEVVML